MYQYPTVTVLMSAYNSAPFILEAVESILKQTWINFEFIIIDDGSSDNSVDLICSFSDKRIKLICNDKNIGLTASLNRGINIAQGKYIARMDADDIAEPNRLSSQVNFLEKHPDIGILGSPCLLFDNTATDSYSIYYVPDNDLEIRWTSLLNNPFAHPTVMLRRDILSQYSLNYDETFKTAQDYEFWTRLLNYTQGANLDFPILRYRTGEGITKTKRESQLKNHDFIAYRTIQNTLPELSISLENVTQIRSLMITKDIYNQSNRSSKLESLKALTEYLRIFNLFISKYDKDDLNIKKLKNKEFVNILKMLLKIIRSSGSYKFSKEVLKQYINLLFKLSILILQQQDK